VDINHHQLSQNYHQVSTSSSNPALASSDLGLAVLVNVSNKCYIWKDISCEILDLNYNGRYLQCWFLNWPLKITEVDPSQVTAKVETVTSHRWASLPTLPRARCTPLLRKTNLNWGFMRFTCNKSRYINWHGAKLHEMLSSFSWHTGIILQVDLWARVP